MSSAIESTRTEAMTESEYMAMFNAYNNAVASYKSRLDEYNSAPAPRDVLVSMQAALATTERDLKQQYATLSAFAARATTPFNHTHKVWRTTVRQLVAAKTEEVDVKIERAQKQVRSLVRTMLHQIVDKNPKIRDVWTALTWIDSHAADIRKRYEDLIVVQCGTIDRYYELPPEIAAPNCAEAFVNVLLWCKREWETLSSPLPLVTPTEAALNMTVLMSLKGLPHRNVENP